MNLKQLYIFGMENSQEPVIKNPVLRAALEGPSITAQEPRMGLDDGGRIGLKRGTNLTTGKRYTFPTGKDNPGKRIQHQDVSIEASKIKSAKLERAKVLLKEGKSKAQATKIIVEEFKLTRHPYAGTAPWMKDAATELITEGYEIVPGKQDTGSKKRAGTKRDAAIGKGKGVKGDPTRFEWRMKKVKTKSGLGQIYETAHTANIFQAKKLGIDYPIDALQLQAKGINQEVAEILDGELKPLYKKQYDLVNKLKKNPTPALRKALNQINYQIAELVSTGGTQGEKAVNVLRAIQVDPYTLKGRVAELGYDISKAVDKGMTGATTKAAQVGTEADVIARANYKQLLKEQGAFKKTVPKAVKPGGGVQLSSGFGALDDLVKSPGAKKIGTIARKTLLSDWVWPEIALGSAEYINRLQKGQTDRAGGETLKLMSLGLYDSGATEEAVLNQAKKLGYDEKDMRALENLMRYNKLGKKIKGYEEALKGMEEGAVDIESEMGNFALGEKIKDLKKEQESVAGFYFGAIGDKDANYGSQIYNDAVTALGNEEFNRTLEDRMRRRDPYAGGIGNWLQNKIFTLDARGRTAEQERIDAMSPQELREFNVQRGVLPVGPTHGAYDRKKFEDLEESLGYMYADGGIANLKIKW